MRFFRESCRFLCLPLAMLMFLVSAPLFGAQAALIGSDQVQNRSSLGLTGIGTFHIAIDNDIKPGQDVQVRVTNKEGGDVECAKAKRGVMNSICSTGRPLECSSELVGVELRLARFFAK